MSYILPSIFIHYMKVLTRLLNFSLITTIFALRVILEIAKREKYISLLGDDRKMEWTEEQYKHFEKFILGDDMDFYEEYTIHLTDEEQEKFFSENPDFMSEYPIIRNKIYLLKDPIYRGLMRKIKKYENNTEDE